MRWCLSHRNGGTIRRQWMRAGLMMVAGLCLWAGPAAASCADPFGNEGDLLFNAEIASLTYCDGT